MLGHLNSNWSKNDSAMVEYEFFHRFAHHYGMIHGYLAFPICLFGIAFNIVNVLVLCQKEMRSATNFMLSAIAVCHTALMSVYVVYVSHLHLVHPDVCDSGRDTYGWAVFTLIYANVTFSVYGLSTWLTVNLAMIRCLVIRTSHSRFSQIETAKKLCAATISIVLIVGIPNYLSFSVRLNEDSSDCKTTTVQTGMRYNVGPSLISQQFDDFPVKMTFMISGILFFLVPCGLLTLFMAYLVWSITNFKRRRSLLIKSPSTGAGSGQNQQQTVMLLVILGIFLITQLPQGILALLCTFLSSNYRMGVYQNLGELMELLSLINASVNFILYCTMSSQFRQAFVHLICPIRQKKVTCDHRKSLLLTPSGRHSLPCSKCANGSSNKTSRSSSLFASESSPLVKKFQQRQSLQYVEEKVIVETTQNTEVQADVEMTTKITSEYECFEVAL